ncbi:hypothetical protein NP493_1230g00018 [Ridgeia piscesae]|uniref:Anoctamin n=1 Tax=Ridgeia piscesae TaxID=27915 RepID=A0AAD9NIJ8_RIDPI|nr:hypothetical protein NP493_1230g00018 [Ridgeia piscesae]
MIMQSAEKTFVLPDVCVKRIDYILIYPVKDIQKQNGQTNVKKRQEQRQSFIAALLEEGVIIQKDINANEILLKLHVPFQKLCEEAERIKLEMPLAGSADSEGKLKYLCTDSEGKLKYLCTDSEVDFVTAPFEIRRMYVFKGYENPDTFFRPALRYYLFCLITPGLPYLVMSRAFTDEFVLHDKTDADRIDLMEPDGVPLVTDPRQDLQNTWSRFFKYQPLWKIRNYFGAKIALYFAWSGLLATSLWIPAIIGICVFIHGLHSVSEVATDLAALSNNLTAAEKVAQMVDASLGIFKKSFDNDITPYYTLVICLWGRKTMFYPAHRQFLKFAASASTLIFMIYDVLAWKLTDWENHRTQTRYDDALIMKLFAFQFVNNYTTLFYIAFLRGDSCGVDNNCMPMLSFQVFTLMISKPLPKFLSDLVIPWLTNLWEKVFFKSSIVEKGFIEREMAKPPLGFFTLEEYTEKVVVYGFLMVGMWYSILQFLNFVGVISNAFLVAFTSSWGRNFTITEKLWIVIGFEVRSRLSRDTPLVIS